MPKFGSFFSNLRARYGRRNEPKTEANVNDTTEQSEKLLPAETKMGDTGGNPDRTEMTNQCGEGTNIGPINEAKSEQQAVGPELHINPEVHTDKSGGQSEEGEPTATIPPREFADQLVTEEERAKN
ncbi:hypothetical protein D915_009223 [Fasciola hepatica]|uniref:Uncharacterized protein n=1 Tax=Fasciola hepatica TaxID=6192 RepID=A0A4E0RD95_FASHE|nr:hypothetical protein D915_009223 [Fasciola hepatica]